MHHTEIERSWGDLLTPTCMRPARPRVGARWGGEGGGQGRTPGSRRRSREDEGTQYHMRFRSPLLCPHPSSARSPGAAPHPRPRSSGPSVHPVPTAAGECTALARRLPSRTHVQHAPSRAPKSRPRPAPPAPCPRPAPPLEAEEDPLIPRSVPSGHAVEIPCLDRGLTHRTALAPRPTATAAHGPAD